MYMPRARRDKNGTRKCIETNDSMVLLLPTSKDGFYAKIDSIYREKVEQYNWTFLATQAPYTRLSQTKTIFLSQYIMTLYGEQINGLDIDHISRDVMDNRVSNLRVCSTSNNLQNMLISKKNTSGYKGVSFDKHAQKYTSYINYNRKKYHIGCFDSCIEAAHSRDQYLRKQSYASFCRYNFPLDNELSAFT